MLCESPENFPDEYACGTVSIIASRDWLPPEPSLGNAAPCSPAWHTVGLQSGSLPVSCPQPASAARTGPAVGVPAPVLKLRTRGPVHALGDMGPPSPQRTQATSLSGWLSSFCLHLCRLPVWLWLAAAPPPLAPQVLSCPVSKLFDVDLSLIHLANIHRG